MDASKAMHLYERLPLFGTGLFLGIALVALHVLLLVKSDSAQRFLQKFPRNQQLGQVLVGIGLIWFLFIIQPPNLGARSFIAMDLGDQFNNMKSFLGPLVIISIVLVAVSIKEFLAVRGLGLLGLMVAAPLLDAAFLKEPVSRLLIPIYCYALIISSLFWVGMPYLFRDAVTWATANQTRWKALCVAGAGYGLAIIICALAFWRGY